MPEYGHTVSPPSALVAAFLLTSTAGGWQARSLRGGALHALNCAVAEPFAPSPQPMHPPPPANRRGPGHALLPPPRPPLHRMGPGAGGDYGFRAPLPPHPHPHAYRHVAHDPHMDADDLATGPGHGPGALMGSLHHGARHILRGLGGSGGGGFMRPPPPQAPQPQARATSHATVSGSSVQQDPFMFGQVRPRVRARLAMAWGLATGRDQADRNASRMQRPKHPSIFHLRCARVSVSDACSPASKPYVA